MFKAKIQDLTTFFLMAIFQLVCFFMFKIKIRDCNVLEVLKQRCATIQEIRNRCLNEELRMAFFLFLIHFNKSTGYLTQRLEGLESHLNAV